MCISVTMLKLLCTNITKGELFWHRPVSFLTVFSFSFWHFFHSGIFPRASKLGEEEEEEDERTGDIKEDGLCFSAPWITSGEKEVKNWRHDENLINRNIWCSINEYWIFNLGQKSVVDGQECVAARVKAHFPCECWQVSISYHLHMPLTLPAIKTSQQHSTDTGEWNEAKNLWMSPQPPRVSLTSHSFSQFSLPVWGPPLPSAFDARAP